MMMLLLVSVLRVKRDGVNEVLVSIGFIHGFEQFALYYECGNDCQIVYFKGYNGKLVPQL